MMGLGLEGMGDGKVLSALVETPGVECLLL